MVGKAQTTFIKQSKGEVVNLDLKLGLARFANLELDLEFKTDFQSCTGLLDLSSNHEFPNPDPSLKLTKVFTL